MIQTVRDNFGKFTERQVDRAIASRDMQARMAHPTDETFKHMVSGKSLDNCSTVASDVTNARTIFGPNRPGLRGEQLDRGQSVLFLNIWGYQGIFTGFIILLL